MLKNVSLPSLIGALLTLFPALSWSAKLSPDYFQRRNLIGRDFGLKAKEIVLTFDDGPGPETLRLLKVLQYHQVPATFFFVGNSLKNFPETAKKSLKIIADNPDLFSIGNHTKNHVNLFESALPGVGQELVWASELLKAGDAKAYKFFRAPYGNFNARMADFMNNDPRYEEFSADYIGPVFWDIGGFYDQKLSKGAYVGDWTCWAKPLKTKILAAKLDPIKFCADGHFNEIVRMGSQSKRTSGIIFLAHDFHVSTVKMFIGTMDVNEAGELVNEDKNSLLYRLMDLKKDGFRFAALDEDQNSIQTLLERP